MSPSDNKDTVYNAKILLFGEYTVIFDSKALTVPYTYFTGQWSFINESKYTRLDRAQESNRSLYEFLSFIDKNPPLNNVNLLDLERFRFELDRGLYFESNIPQGYGVGSSGALVAALYRRYSPGPITALDAGSINQLKKVFSALETYFHGTSSGMDPLNCYIGKPLLFEGSKKAQIIEAPGKTDYPESAIFLINSGFPSATQPLVQLFLQKAENTDFKKKINDSLIPATNKCIEKLIEGNMKNFYTTLHELSSFQFEHFSEMIPEKFINLWRQGLENQDFTLKLCGSGGGGFLLGFTRDYSIAEKLVEESGIDIIPVYKNTVFKN